MPNIDHTHSPFENKSSRKKTTEKCFFNMYLYNLLLVIYIELTCTLNLCKHLRLNLCKFKGIMKYLVWNIRVITCNNNLSIHIHMKI